MQTRSTTSPRLWVPPLSRARELVAVFCQNTGERSPTRIGRALGLSPRHVRRLLAAGLPRLTYARSWVPIAGELLASAVLSVPAKILATSAPMFGMGKRAARRLGWPLSRTRTARRSLQRHAFPTTDRGSSRRTKVPPQSGQRYPHLNPGSLSPSVLWPKSTSSIRRARAAEKTPDQRNRRSDVDGWRSILQEGARASLSGGRHVASLLAVLTSLGFYERSERSRAAFALRIANAGCSVETLLGYVEVLVNPPPSLGRVRSRAGTLRSWLDNGDAPTVRPVTVGAQVVARGKARAVKVAAEADSRAADRRALDLARAALSGTPRMKASEVDALLRACKLAEGDYRAAALALSDLGGTVEALAVCAVRQGISERLAEVVGSDLRARFVRAMLEARCVTT